MREGLAEGEKPLHWVSYSKRDFLGFPAPVKDDMGNALGIAQFGGTAPMAKPWKGRKKSPQGIRTAKRDVDLVAARLKAAAEDYEEHYGKPKR